MRVVKPWQFVTLFVVDVTEDLTAGMDLEETGWKVYPDE